MEYDHVLVCYIIPICRTVKNEIFELWEKSVNIPVVDTVKHFTQDLGSSPKYEDNRNIIYIKAL